MPKVLNQRRRPARLYRDEEGVFIRVDGEKIYISEDSAANLTELRKMIQKTPLAVHPETQRGAINTSYPTRKLTKSKKGRNVVIKTGKSLFSSKSGIKFQRNTPEGTQQLENKANRLANTLESNQNAPPAIRIKTVSEFDNTLKQLGNIRANELDNYRRLMIVLKQHRTETNIDNLKRDLLNMKREAQEKGDTQAEGFTTKAIQSIRPLIKDQAKAPERIKQLTELLKDEAENTIRLSQQQRRLLEREKRRLMAPPKKTDTTEFVSALGGQPSKEVTDAVLDEKGEKLKVMNADKQITLTSGDSEITQSVSESESEPEGKRDAPIRISENRPIIPTTGAEQFSAVAQPQEIPQSEETGISTGDEQQSDADALAEPLDDSDEFFDPEIGGTEVPTTGGAEAEQSEAASVEDQRQSGSDDATSVGIANAEAKQSEATSVEQPEDLPEVRDEEQAEPPDPTIEQAGEEADLDEFLGKADREARILKNDPISTETLEEFDRKALAYAQYVISIATSDPTGKKKFKKIENVPPLDIGDEKEAEALLRGVNIDNLPDRYKQEIKALRKIILGGDKGGHTVRENRKRGVIFSDNVKKLNARRLEITDEPGKEVQRRNTGGSRDINRRVRELFRGVPIGEAASVETEGDKAGTGAMKLYGDEYDGDSDSDTDTTGVDSQRLSDAKRSDQRMGTTQGELEEWLEQTLEGRRGTNNLGVFCIDEIPSLINKIKPKHLNIGIMNTTERREPLGHWITIAVDDRSYNRSVEVMDPLGNLEPEYYEPRLKSEIAAMLPHTKIPYLLKYKFNGIRFQRANSDNCGIHCILYISKRLNAPRMKDVIFDDINASEEAAKEFKKILSESKYVCY